MPSYYRHFLNQHSSGATDWKKPKENQNFGVNTQSSSVKKNWAVLYYSAKSKEERTTTSEKQLILAINILTSSLKDPQMRWNCNLECHYASSSNTLFSIWEHCWKNSMCMWPLKSSVSFWCSVQCSSQFCTIANSHLCAIVYNWDWNVQFCAIAIGGESFLWRKLGSEVGS